MLVRWPPPPVGAATDLLGSGRGFAANVVIVAASEVWEQAVVQRNLRLGAFLASSLGRALGAK